MTIHLTAWKNTPEVEAAKAFLDFQGVNYVQALSHEYLSNNGGKGSLVAFLDGYHRIGGFFDLVDWLRNNGHARL